ncbi:MAG: DNA polymerase I [Anaerovoracaceae bacterium]|jgi:DNA polymerase-1
MENRIMIIDGNSLMNRAFYAMRNPMITKDGLYTQGVYGFLNMLNRIEKDYEPTHIAVCFDMKAPTFRHKEYAEYKAGRKKMPPELAMEMPVLKDVLRAMNIKIVEMEGYEADDLIGTISTRAEAEGLEPYIFTGDKDQLQLATDVTKIIYTKRGVTEFDVYDKDKMIEVYGFTPKQFIDYKGLMGDPSDNIPGVPGVGPKTAGKLIQKYGSVEGVLEHTDELKKGKVRDNIIEYSTQALMSKRLATIFTDVPIETDFEEYRLEEPDTEALVDIYKRLEFNSFLKKLGSKAGAEETAKKPLIDESDIEMNVIRTEDELSEAAGGIFADGMVLKIFGNADHLNVPVLTGAAVLSGGKYYYLDFGSASADAPGLHRKFAEEMDRRKPAVTGHDLKYDYYMLMHCGQTSFRTEFDTSIGKYVTDPGRRDYSITTLAEEYLGAAIETQADFEKAHSQIDLFGSGADDYAAYGRKWCVIAEQLADAERKDIEKGDLGRVIETEFPLIEVMAFMEFAGFRADASVLEKTGGEIAEEIERLTREIYDLAGEEFNINSPKQLGPILFEKLGIPAGKKTKTGYSTSADILEKRADKHPIIPKILEYRMLSKLKGTYIDGLIPLIAADGKIHARFNQTIAATGRISSSDPNLQNIPVRQEFGRTIRKAFLPSSDEYKLVGADYSQIELRVLAHMSGDEELIKSFNNGEDIHRATAARVLGIPEDEITPEQRSRAKAVSFGVIYGISSFGLSSNIHTTRKEAEEYINQYYEKHKAVKKFMDGQIEFCKEHGYVETLLGRKRYIKEINARNYMDRQLGERLAMNSPIQGSAADIIKIAMIRVMDALRGMRSQLILQVHDELIIDTYRPEEEQVKKILTECMENAMDLKVKLKVDLSEGETWYEMK